MSIRRRKPPVPPPYAEMHLVSVDVNGRVTYVSDDGDTFTSDYLKWLKFGSSKPVSVILN